MSTTGIHCNVWRVEAGPRQADLLGEEWVSYCLILKQSKGFACNTFQEVRAQFQI